MLVLSWLLWGHYACLSTINGKERFDQHTGVLTGENTVNTVNTLLTCVLFMFIVYITSLSHGLVLQQHGNTLLQIIQVFDWQVGFNWLVTTLCLHRVIVMQKQCYAVVLVMIILIGVIINLTPYLFLVSTR